MGYTANSNVSPFSSFLLNWLLHVLGDGWKVTSLTFLKVNSYSICEEVPEEFMNGLLRDTFQMILCFMI